MSRLGFPSTNRVPAWMHRVVVTSSEWLRRGVEFGVDFVLGTEAKIGAMEPFSAGTGLGRSLFGQNGIPVGALIALSGAPGAGKTTLAWQLIADAQAQGGACLFLDVDHSSHGSWVARLGAQAQRLGWCRPLSIEDARQMLERCLRVKGLRLVVLDPLPALVSREARTRPLRAEDARQSAEDAVDFVASVLPRLTQRGVTMLVTVPDAAAFMRSLSTHQRSPRARLLERAWTITLEMSGVNDPAVQPPRTQDPMAQSVCVAVRTFAPSSRREHVRADLDFRFDRGFAPHAPPMLDSGERSGRDPR